MKCVIDFIKEYWVQLIFFASMISAFYWYERTRIEAKIVHLETIF